MHTHLYELAISQFTLGSLVLLLEIFDLSKQFQIHELISTVTMYNIQKSYHHYVTGEKTRGSKTVHNLALQLDEKLKI